MIAKSITTEAGPYIGQTLRKVKMIQLTPVARAPPEPTKKPAPIEPPIATRCQYVF